MKKQLSLIASICLIGSAVSAQTIAQTEGIRIKGAGQPILSSMPMASAPSAQYSPLRVPAVVTDGYAYYDYDCPDDEVNFYTFQTYGLNTMYYRGFVHGTTADLNTRTFLAEWPHLWDSPWDCGEDVIDGGCFVGDEYWAYVSGSEMGGATHTPHGLYKIDLATGLKGDLLWDHAENGGKYNCVMYEFSYDPVTDYVYALQKAASGWMGLEPAPYVNVVRFDPTNPGAGPEQIGTLSTANGYFYGMACDNGIMYVLQKYTVDGDNKGAAMYKIDLEEYGSFSLADMDNMGLINHGFLKIEYYQSMEFDHTTHTLWWAGENSDGRAFFTTIDVETLETMEELRTINSDYQYIAFGIPYQVVDDNAPSFVRNLTYKAADEGVERVDFKWTNPTTNYQKGALSSLTAIKVYRDGQLLTTLEPTGMGQEQTWVDETPSSGNHIYKFVPVNESGDGLYKERKMFVGRDVPGKPYYVNVDTEGTHAVISWAPADRGIYGGWYDHSTLVYDIVRYPDNKVLATNYAQTSIEDDADTFRGYYYTVTPKCVDGVGEMATSKVSPFGPAMAVPYFNDFTDPEEARMMTILDGNRDGHSWAYSESPLIENRSYIYGTSLGEADDYLILPPMVFEDGKMYEIRFTYASSNFYQTRERIQVVQGTKNTVEEMSKNILETYYGVPENMGNYKEGRVYITDVAKGNFIGIRAASDANQGWINIGQVLLREYSATDLSVVDVLGPQYSYVNQNNPYTVTVHNEGYAATDAGVAVLFDYNTGNILATAEVGTIEAGEDKDVTIIWTPTEKIDEIVVSVRVDLNGDTYPKDNEWDNFIHVTVTDGQASDWKLVCTRMQTGWRPIYTLIGKSHMEVIYMMDEIGLTEADLTGIALTYNPAEYTDDLKEVPVQIALGLTDDTTTDHNYPNRQYKVYFDGTVDLSSTTHGTDATMMFDKPFYYKGDQNLLVRIISDGPATKDNVNWYIQDEQSKWPELGSNESPEMRSVFSGSNMNQALNDQIPVLKLAYRTPSGVEGVVTFGGQFQVVDGAIVFAETQEKVVVYDMAGKMVYAGVNVDTISGLGLGFYNVVATNGGEIVSGKIAIR